MHETYDDDIAGTILRPVELTCPTCSCRFASQAVRKTNAFGGMHTDFRVRALGTQPLPYLLHTCMRCGYTAGEQDFGDHADVSCAVKAQVWSELAPRLPVGPMTGSAKYEFAATLAGWQGAQPQEVGDLQLRAAWCCVDEHDVEAEYYFRRKAARAFELALDTIGGVDAAARAALTYLVGELWRRVGCSARANDWFARVAHEVTLPAEQAWIAMAAERQRNDPVEWFG